MRTVQEIMNEAFALHGAGRLSEAANIYDRLLGYTQGDDANVLYAYGTLLAGDGHHGLASYLLGNAVKTFPAHAPSWVNLGIALKNLDRNKAALECYEQALRLEPSSPEALSNIAGWYINRGMPEKVVEYGRRAVASAAPSPQCRNHLALGLMEMGRFDEAWPLYEARWDLPERIKDRRPFTCPKWDGRKVKFLAIHGEQGVGDEILFLLCLEKVRPLAEKIVIECADRLVTLFERSLQLPCYATHKELVEAHGEPDAYIPMGSLAGVVGLPRGEPYLKARNVARVPRRIGIAWQGGTNKTNKRERSMALDTLAPILRIPGFEFVSVQYGGDEVAVDARAHGLKTNFVGKDMEDIADEIASCELVISVCQTAVHLAGALGVPCWVLTPKQCAWRYSTKPWYRSVTLCRQDDTETWEPVVEKIAADLRATVLS